MVKITITIAKITNAMYLLADHLIWIGRMGIMKVNLTKCNRTANRYWLMTIGMNLVRDIYEIIKVFQRERHSLYLKLHKNPVLLDTIKNGCDLFIPLTALGHVRCTSGTIGILGMISSLIGLYTIIDPYSKIYPS